MVDGKADLSDIVDAIEQVEGAQRIAGKLAVLLRRHQDAEPVLVVNDVEKPVRYDDAVPGAEAALDPHIAGIVEPLLHKHQRVGAAFPGLCHFLHYEGAVPLGTVLHLLGVVGQVLRGVLHPAAEGFFHLIGAQLMAVGPLLAYSLGLSAYSSQSRADGGQLIHLWLAEAERKECLPIVSCLRLSERVRFLQKPFKLRRVDI